MSKGNTLASKNAIEYKAMQRENMEKAIDDAICYLRGAGLPVTKKAIADELGCHKNTLQQSYIREILLRYKEFQHSGKDQKDISQLEQRIQQLEKMLSNSRNYNMRLVSENEKLRQERNQYEDKYRHLLGEYQTVVGKKRIGY